MGYSRTHARTDARTKTIFLVNGFKTPALRAGHKVFRTLVILQQSHECLNRAYKVNIEDRCHFDDPKAHSYRSLTEALAEQNGVLQEAMRKLEVFLGADASMLFNVQPSGITTS